MKAWIFRCALFIQSKTFTNVLFQLLHADSSHYLAPPLIFLPYIVCFLFHLANWLSWLRPSSALRRLISRTHRHSPQWLRYTLAWCWPNIGFFLHVYRLLMAYMLVLGLLPQNAAVLSVSEDANRAKLIRIINKLGLSNLMGLPIVIYLPFLLFKSMIMACESYDLRAGVLVAFLLDGPVWHMRLQSLGITNEVVICNVFVTIFTHVLMASIRRRHFLEARSIAVVSAASSRSLSNKKSN